MVFAVIGKMLLVNYRLRLKMNFLKVEIQENTILN